GALDARPRPKAHELRGNVAHGRQPFDSGIDPGFHWHIAQRDALGVRLLLWRPTGDVSSGKALVVVLVINMPPDHVADSATHHDIAHEVLAGGDTRQADSRSSTVEQRLAQPSGILVRQHRCNRPREGGMGGKERVAAAEEMATSIFFARTKPA